MQKKGISTIAFLLMFTIQAIARVPMKVTMGTVDVFRKECKALVVFDHSNPIVKKKSGERAKDYYKGDDWLHYADFCADMKYGSGSFVKYFNKKKPTLSVGMELLEGTETPADYTMRVIIDRVKMQRVKASYLCGRIILENNGTGEQVCIVEFDRIKGNPNPMFKFRMSTAYSYLAYHLLTLLYKNI